MCLLCLALAAPTASPARHPCARCQSHDNAVHAACSCSLCRQAPRLTEQQFAPLRERYGGGSGQVHAFSGSRDGKLAAAALLTALQDPEVGLVLMAAERKGDNGKVLPFDKLVWKLVAG